MTYTPQPPFEMTSGTISEHPQHAHDAYAHTGLVAPKGKRGGGQKGSSLGFLRNMSIRNKMFFVALPPLVVVFILSVIGVFCHRGC